MPLKPIFEKYPLMTMNSLPLRPGQARIADEKMTTLYGLTVQAEHRHEVWEGAFRLAALLKSKPLEEPVACWINDAFAKQQEDGAFDMELSKALCVACAGLAMYEYDARRPLLEKLISFCAWVAENWKDVIACGAVRQHSADLMAFLQQLYRVTGKKAILSLCDKLRQQAMDWSGILHTFAVQRPMNRVTAWEDMKAGMEAENGSEEGFYTRQYLTCHGESLADGLRSSCLNGRFSGNGHELSAARTGWEKIHRYHGAVCGGITADETIGGRSPSCGVDAASLGAWAESLAQADDQETWAFEALDTLVHNGLPAALVNDKLVPYQRVNSLSVNSGTKDCYNVHDCEEQAWRAVARLSRGWAAAASHAVTMQPHGCAVNLLMNGKFAISTEDGAFVAAVEGDTMTISAKKPVKASIRVRIPAWTDDACITINNEGGLEGKPGSWLELDRVWHNGDTIRMDFAAALKVTGGHHQSSCISFGPNVMAYVPADDCWAVALVDGPVMQDGQVVATLRPTQQWRKRSGIPADLPVLPETEGECFTAVLRPYAEAPCRIALFPKGDKE